MPAEREIKCLRGSVVAYVTSCDKGLGASESVRHKMKIHMYVFY